MIHAETYRSPSALPNSGHAASYGNQYDHTGGRLYDNDTLVPRSLAMDVRGPPSPSRQAYFRPLVLPQVAYGAGHPFLRGYSDELARYGISDADFVAILDSINVAMVPNPENQIFQKGANIAGFFL